MVPEGRARIAYGFAIANNKSFASSARNAFSLDARASRIVFVFRDRRGIVDSLTRRWSAERTLRDSAENVCFALCWYRNRIGFGALEALHFFISGRGFGVLVPLRACTSAIPSAPDVDDVRLSLHVHGQPRGVGLWPRCHRRAHGSRRGEQGRRRRKQRVLPREGVRQDDDEVVARGCVPAHPADERETRNARRRDRARDATARSGRVASERAEARAPGSARRRRVGPRLFGPRVSGKSVASRPVAFSLSASLGFRSRRAHNHQSYPFSYAR